MLLMPLVLHILSLCGCALDYECFCLVYVFGHNLIAVVVDLEKWNISQSFISPSQTMIILCSDSIHLSKSRCMYLGAFDLSNFAA
jgi:hypothetical protein